MMYFVFFHTVWDGVLCIFIFIFLQERSDTDTNQEGFVHDSPGNVKTFLDAVNTIKPTAIIGKPPFSSYFLLF